MSRRDTGRHEIVAWQTASLLLTYPDERLLQRIDLLRAAAATLPSQLRQPLSGMIEHVGSTPLGELQRRYVATFDLRKRCCLYLSWWVHGDTRNRGHALVAFNATYRDAGTSPPAGELPDHLAVVLEFAATVNRHAGETLLVEHRPGLELLRQALHKASSPYAGVLDAVCSTLPGPTEDAVAQARKIAATGPPSELVGLEPYRMAPR